MTPILGALGTDDIEISKATRITDFFDTFEKLFSRSGSRNSAFEGLIGRKSEAIQKETLDKVAQGCIYLLRNYK